MDNTEISKQPANIISVDAGAERVTIVNNLGEEIGTFSFNPHDVGILARFDRVAGDFEKITEPLDSLGLGPDNPADRSNTEVLAALDEAKKRLYEAMDYLLGGSVSEAFFDRVHPFSPVNGKFYCENVLEAVGNYLAARLGGETKKLSARMDAYTHGRNTHTRTGKHRNGKT